MGNDGEGQEMAERGVRTPATVREPLLRHLRSGDFVLRDFGYFSKHDLRPKVAMGLSLRPRSMTLDHVSDLIRNTDCAADRLEPVAPRVVRINSRVGDPDLLPNPPCEELARLLVEGVRL